MNMIKFLISEMPNYFVVSFSDVAKYKIDVTNQFLFLSNTVPREIIITTYNN